MFGVDEARVSARPQYGSGSVYQRSHSNTAWFPSAVSKTWRS